MAKFAPVCPIHVLAELYHNKDAGDYHLPLAHDVLNHPVEYEKVFSWIHRYYSHTTVILDNSVIELGEAVNIDTIAGAAAIVKANVIVLPDVLLHTDKTIDACEKAIIDWKEPLNNALGKDSWEFMIVPQGRTLESWVRCAEHFAMHDDIGWWGIPRNFNIHGLGSRQEAVEIAHMLDPYNKIHLLGFSDNMLDDMLSARNPNVMGIDSAVPLRMGSMEEEITITKASNLPPRGTWWDDPSTRWNALMTKNVSKVRFWINSQDRK